MWPNPQNIYRRNPWLKTSFFVQFALNVFSLNDKFNLRNYDRVSKKKTQIW